LNINFHSYLSSINTNKQSTNKPVGNIFKRRRRRTRREEEDG